MKSGARLTVRHGASVCHGLRAISDAAKLMKELNADAVPSSGIVGQLPKLNVTAAEVMAASAEATAMMGGLTL